MVDTINTFTMTIEIGIKKETKVIVSPCQRL
jgi:hypothetical protein